MNLYESEYWDEVGQVWGAAHPDPLWRVHSDAINGNLLDKWLATSGLAYLLKTDAFDEACSRGLFELLKSRARHVIGMDISAPTLVAAREHHPSYRAVAADVRRLPFAGDAFDVIVSNSTLDHFPTLTDLETGIRELHRVLRPGGQLILTLDNPLNPMVALRNILPFGLLRRVGLVPYYVGVTRGHRRLRAILTGIGFDVVESTAILHCPRVLAVAMSRFMVNGTPASRNFLRCLMAFEGMAKLPTRFLTGYFTATRAVKRS